MSPNATLVLSSECKSCTHLEFRFPSPWCQSTWEGNTLMRRLPGDYSVKAKRSGKSKCVIHSVVKVGKTYLVKVDKTTAHFSVMTEKLITLRSVISNLHSHVAHECFLWTLSFWLTLLSELFFFFCFLFLLSYVCITFLATLLFPALESLSSSSMQFELLYVLESIIITTITSNNMYPEIINSKIYVKQELLGEGGL